MVNMSINVVLGGLLSRRENKLYHNASIGILTWNNHSTHIYLYLLKSNLITDASITVVHETRWDHHSFIFKRNSPSGP